MNTQAQTQTQTITLEDIYYLPSKSKYFRKMEDGQWRGFCKDDTKQYLTVKYNISCKKVSATGVSPADEVIQSIQKERCIDDTVALAGYSEGIHIFNGQTVLVTKSPTLIPPVKGDYTPLHVLFTQMLGDEQRDVFYGWLKYSIKNLREKSSYLGQAIFYVGEGGSCKSLILQLTTELLGGRYCDPHQYLTGQTSFNEHMFEAEHLTIDDKPGQNWGENQEFSMLCKNVTASDTQMFHPKGGKPKQYSPKWRLSVALNDTESGIKSIPVLDPSMSDKITIFKVSKPNMDIPQAIIEDRAALFVYFKSHIPAFLYYIINEHVVKESLLDKNYRFGVAAYRSPAVVSKLTNPSHISLYIAISKHLGNVHVPTILFTPSALLRHFKLMNVPLDKSYSSPITLGRRLNEMLESSLYKDIMKGNNHNYMFGIGFNVVDLDELIDTCIAEYNSQEHSSRTSYNAVFANLVKQRIACDI